MFKKFKTKELVFMALISTLIFVVALSIGALIVSITGASMAGGLITGFIMAYLFAIAVLIIRKFGTAIIIATTVSALSIPTINMGPPGVHKLVIGLAIGLVIDSVIYFGRYRKLSYYIAIPLAYTISLPVNLFIIKLMGLPGFEKILSMLPIGMAIYLIEAIIGVWLAFLTYAKLKNKTIIKQISN